MKMLRFLSLLQLLNGVFSNRIFHFLPFCGVFRSKTEVRKTTLFQKIAKNSKTNSMCFKYPLPLAIVWLCVLKKT
jgi:hypothetical protein